MEENALQILLQDLLGPAETIRQIQRRQQELHQQEAEWRARRDAAEKAGETLPSLLKDETYLNFRAEQEKIRKSLDEYRQRPRLTKDQTAELRERLTPEEKTQHRQTLLQHLQSNTPETKAVMAATMEKVIAKMISEHGQTPELEAAIAKARKLQDSINQSP